MQTQVKHKGKKNKDRKCKSGQDTRGIKLRKKQKGSPQNPKSWQKQSIQLNNVSGFISISGYCLYLRKAAQHQHYASVYQLHQEDVSYLLFSYCFCCKQKSSNSIIDGRNANTTIWCLFTPSFTKDFELDFFVSKKSSPMASK